MINRINTNISFKKAYVDPAVEVYYSNENINKINNAAEMVDTLYPNLDVFFHADTENRVIYQIQKSEPLMALLDKDIFPRVNVKIEDLIALINFKILFNDIHNKLWNKKIPFMLETSEDLNNMDEMDLASEVHYSICNFNRMHPEEYN